MRILLAILFTINSFIVFAEAQEFGIASVYSATFQGKKTANGEFFNHGDFTAAHLKYPFGSLVRVTRVDNGKWVIVRINDRGPFVSNRVTDISKAAALRLGMTNEKEEVRVKLELVHNRVAEIGQSKVQNNTRDAQQSNNHSYSTPSSEKAEVTSKSVQEKAVIREYKYVPNNTNRNTSSQKKNLKM